MAQHIDIPGLFTPENVERRRYPSGSKRSTVKLDALWVDQSLNGRSAFVVGLFTHGGWLDE